MLAVKPSVAISSSSPAATSTKQSANVAWDQIGVRGVLLVLIGCRKAASYFYHYHEHGFYPIREEAVRMKFPLAAVAAVLTRIGPAMDLDLKSFPLPR